MKHKLIPVELSSGSKGLLVDIPGSTVVNMEFTFLSGYEFVEPGKYEVPHSMEHLIFGANAHYKSASSFSRELSLNGAYHNAYTNSLLNGYVAEAPAFEWERIMELFWQGLTTPKFLPKEFKSEQETVVEELYSKLDVHGLMLDVAIVQAMGDSHLQDYATRIKQIADITPQDLKRHHRYTHNASNMRFIVAGSLADKRTAITRLIDKYSRQLPTGERKKIVAEQLIQPLGPVALKRETDKVHFAVRAAIYGELSERELIALGMLDYILTVSWDSRIFGRGRRKGLLYHIASHGSSSNGVSHFSLHGSVVPEKAGRLFDFIAVELIKLKDRGISAAELKRAKQNMIGAFQINHQTTQSLVNWYARYFTRDDYFEFDKRPEIIKSITRRDIERLIDQFTGNSAVWGVGVVAKDSGRQAAALHREMGRVWH